MTSFKKRPREEIRAVNERHFEELKSINANHKALMAHNASVASDVDDFANVFNFDGPHKHMSISQIASIDGKDRAKLFAQPDVLIGDSNVRQQFEADFAEKGLAMLSAIPIRTSDFPLLPEQRMMIAFLASTPSKPVFNHQAVDPEFYRELRRKRPRPEVRVELEAHTYPAFQLLDTPAGSGKTTMAIIYGFVMLTQQWEMMNETYHHVLRMRQLHPHSGVVFGPDVSASKLARVIIVHSSEAMMEHWASTAEACRKGFFDVRTRKTFQIWCTQSWFNTGPKSQRSTETLKRAYEDGLNDVVTIWIMPPGDIRARVFAESPEYGVAVEIYDEVVGHIRIRKTTLQSPTYTSLIVNATPASLHQATKGQPEHPVRRLFGGDDFCPVEFIRDNLVHNGIANGFNGDEDRVRYRRNGNLSGQRVAERQINHFALMGVFSPPAHLNVAVQLGIERHMPAGVSLYRIPVKISRMSQSILSSKFTTCSFAELVEVLLRGVDTEIVDSIVAFFTTAGSMNQTDIMNKLQELIESMSEMDPNETRAKRALLRVKERFDAYFNDALPDDPVTLEPISKDDAMIMSCCTAVVAKSSVEDIFRRGNARCPMCRAPIMNVFNMCERLAEPADSSDASRASSPMSAASDDSDAVDAPPDVNAFTMMCQELYDKEPHIGDALKEVVSHQLNEKANSRIVLALDYGEMHYGGGSRAMEEAMRALIEVRGVRQDRIHDIESLSRDTGAVADAMTEFKSNDALPCIFLIDTKERSKSVVGLDLPNTDLIIISDRCSAHTLRQTMGRALRMQRRTANMSAMCRFPSKRFVIFSNSSVANRRPAPVVDLE